MNLRADTVLAFLISYLNIARETRLEELVVRARRTKCGPNPVPVKRQSFRACTKLRLLEVSVAVVLVLVLGLSGCAVVTQSAVCGQYIACVEALDTLDGQTTNVERFADGGACWGGVEGGALCTRACERGLKWLAEATVDSPEACQ